MATNMNANPSDPHAANPSQTLGPARPEDIPAVTALANEVFRSSPRPGDMGREFPALFASDNAENLYIARRQDRIVSHVGVFRQTINTCGIEIPTACIGAVCTSPDARKVGLASQLLSLAINDAVDRGDLLMPISGRRTLYLRRGARRSAPKSVSESR